MNLEQILSDYPIIVSIVVFAVIMLLTWLVEHIVFKIIKNIGLTDKTPLPSSTIFANIARVCIWLAGFALAAKVAFNFDLTGIVAALGVGGIALSLGMQDTLQNLIGGLQVSLGKLIEPGDYIEIGGQRGQVIDINWRHTTIKDASGPNYVIPNSVINRSAITKLGESGKRYVAFQIPVGADFDEFSKRALEYLKAAIPEESLGEGGIKIQFVGEELGLASGNVVIDTLHSYCPPSVTLDTAARALEPALKEAGGAVVSTTRD